MINAKRCLTGLLIGSLVTLGAGGAQTIASTQPAGTVAAGPVTTAPAATVVGDVLVAPFKPLGDAGPDWIARAVQENLVTDLSVARFHPAKADKAFEDNTAAVSAAQSISARYVVVGTFQPADGLLRFTGQILNVKTGQSVAGMSATGSVRDLFALEDSLSQQAIRAIATQPGPMAQGAIAGAAPLQPAPVGAVVGVPAMVVNGNLPAAPPGNRYQGSALQAYVEANRTPSQDYNTQVQNSRDNSTFGTYIAGPATAYGYGYGYPYANGIGYGGFGFGSIVYSGNGIGYGWAGGGYGWTGGGHGGSGSGGGRSAGDGHGNHH